MHNTISRFRMTALSSDWIGHEPDNTISTHQTLAPNTYASRIILVHNLLLLIPKGRSEFLLIAVQYTSVSAASGPQLPNTCKRFQLYNKMHILVHVYMVTLIFFYFFILLIRFWDDIFGESGDVSLVTPPDMALLSTPTFSSMRLPPLYRQSGQETLLLKKPLERATPP